MNITWIFYTTMLKPYKIKKWDTIALISPSWWLAWLLPHKIENIIKFFENEWFKVVLGPHSMLTTWYTAGTIEDRVSDLHWCFSNKDIKAIICNIWWFHSNQLIEYIDYELIKNNPKIFVWFSDISVLHFAIYTKSNLVTFYWPAWLTQFWEFFWIDNYTYDYFKKAVMYTKPIWSILPSLEWTDDLLNWFTKEDMIRPKIKKSNSWFKWLKWWKTEWKIIWWCITSILHLRWTDYWPNFDNTIFFWEIPESSADLSKWEPNSRVDAHLQDLKLSWVFDKIKWMIVWRPKWYTNEEWEKFYKIILKNTEKHFFPILCDVDIGHTDPIITIPLWINVELDSYNNSLIFKESWVI